MSITDEIRQPILREISEYERFLARYMRSDSEFVDGILSYILENGGKGIRPLTVLLSAALHTPSPERGLGLRTYLGAMLVEMMHTASLVHDDVIDESDLRRGKPSVRATWGSRSAVITGDMILAKSITAGLDSAQYDIVDYVVRAMGELCEGELIQSEQSRSLTMTREIYLDIISKKTAVLFGVSAGVGALSVSASREDAARMHRFGELIGTAFQIKDDILDYDTRTDTGKPACNDLKEKKITLPLLVVLERSDVARREELLARLAAVGGGVSGAPGVSNGAVSGCSGASEGAVSSGFLGSVALDENIEYLHDTVVHEGGIEEAEGVMQAYIARALDILAEYPDSPYKKSLVKLAFYAGDRRK